MIGTPCPIVMIPPPVPAIADTTDDTNCKQININWQGYVRKYNNVLMMNELLIKMLTNAIPNTFTKGFEEARLTTTNDTLMSSRSLSTTIEGSHPSKLRTTRPPSAKNGRQAIPSRCSSIGSFDPTILLYLPDIPSHSWISSPPMKSASWSRTQCPLNTSNGGSNLPNSNTQGPNLSPTGRTPTAPTLKLQKTPERWDIDGRYPGRTTPQKLLNPL